MDVCLQDPKRGTCVSCAVINVLRHFGLPEPSVDEVANALRLGSLHGKDGSTTTKAAQYLRRVHKMDVRISRPSCTIRDQAEAAREAAKRFEAMLNQGFVGLLHRKESAGSGHAVVLHHVLWMDGKPFFACYDSNKREQKGNYIYDAADYLFWEDAEVDVKITATGVALTPANPPHPTGRIAYFCKPGFLKHVTLPDDCNPFRAKPFKRRAPAAQPVPGDRVTGDT